MSSTSLKTLVWYLSLLHLGTGTSLAALDISIQAGVGINYLLMSLGTLDYFARRQINPDLTFQRRRLTYSGLLNVKIRKSLDFLMFGLSFNYRYGLNNLIEEQERYTDQSLVFDWGYVPDDLRLSSFHLNLEIIIPLTFHK